jgi:osmotically-inducible protein OsmY
MNEEPVIPTFAHESLAAAVQAALAKDERTAPYPIEVEDENGVITLVGKVPSHWVRETAEGIASGVPGVVTVVSELEAEAHDKDPEVVRQDL